MIKIDKIAGKTAYRIMHIQSSIKLIFKNNILGDITPETPVGKHPGTPDPYLPASTAVVTPQEA